MQDSNGKQIIRILDANINRAAEGLRTLEDAARLSYEDESGAALLKELRHHFARAVSQLDRTTRLQVRSLERDAGAGITATDESNRAGITEIVVAASERVTQSLRQLEEFAKVVSAEAGLEFKHLRYRAYDDLAQLELRWLASAWDPASSRLYLLIDCSKPVDEFVAYVAELSDSGVDVFQLRDKSADGAQLIAYGRALSQALSGKDSRFVVNDRVDIAMAIGADGVHLGQEDMPLADARALVGRSMAVGISTHDLEQVRTAEREGADYIGCGPTFPSQTKTFTDFAGIDFIRQVAASTGLPAFAIGGIGSENLGAVVEAGLTRIAVSQSIHSAPSPTRAARSLKEALEQRCLLDSAATPRSKTR
jgi:thiamine-phosphate pyrophosphorylase